jgi:hypothetical protein
MILNPSRYSIVKWAKVYAISVIQLFNPVLFFDDDTIHMIITCNIEAYDEMFEEMESINKRFNYEKGFVIFIAKRISLLRENNEEEISSGLHNREVFEWVTQNYKSVIRKNKHIFSKMKRLKNKEFIPDLLWMRMG